MIHTLAKATIPTPDTSGLSAQLHDPAFWGKVLAVILCAGFLIALWKALKSHPWVLIGTAVLVLVGAGVFTFNVH